MADRSPEAQLRAELARTSVAQLGAADPEASAWVSANAGTGKTHVLTNRVLRLLLAGTAPERILCLTFTKAAAAEMSSRVFARLARWVTADDAALVDDLTRLADRAPEAAEVAKARDLFTIAIETPGGLKVQTIHAFCERLLQRFPLEAGVSPQFAILDEQTGRDLEREAVLSVLAEATRAPQSRLGRALATAVAYAADATFDELLRVAMRRRDWLEAAPNLDDGGERHSGADALYRQLLGVRARGSAADIARELAGVLKDGDLARIATVLGDGGKTGLKHADLLRAARQAGTATARIAALESWLLTGEGEPRKSLLSAKIAAAHPALDDLAKAAQSRFGALAEEHAAALVLEATMALLALADVAGQRYANLKRRRAALDYEDLIHATAKLLSTSAEAQWVLYKLDGGLDHILVDEAQDTSPDQWRIVKALADEFFSGAGRSEGPPRTLFAVGDEKQSIYGFQGAAPEMFAAMGRRLGEAARDAGQVWRPIPLTLSFRTTAPILAAVDDVFAGPAAEGVTASGEVVRHAAHRLGAAGLVEIWDTEKADAPGDAEPWAPLADKGAASPVLALSERIAATIEGWLASGEMLASEARPVRAGDILILVRKRQPFAPAMVAALKARGIPVAGADRIRLGEQLVVQDLVALADFLLLPEEDLALATVLKSPLCGLDDDDLMALAPGRRGSLWSALLKAAPASVRFGAVADLLKRWRGRADLVPPFEFLAEILERDGMRARLLARLGAEAADPLDAFLNLALSYDDGAPPSLQGFVDWFRRTELELKRDMEHGCDEVRVLTVHGAKGLEAPIVFLPDTCTTRVRNGPLLKVDGVPLPSGIPPPFLWPVKGATSRVAALRQCRDEGASRDGEERNRLLYVALTRPRDRLYVAGFEAAGGRGRGCWYDLVSDALDGRLAAAEDAAGRRVRRLATPQEAPPVRRGQDHGLAVSAMSLPGWAMRPAPREPGLVVPLAPSRLAPLDTDAEGEPVERLPATVAEPPTLPPAAASDGQRFLRGTLTHALLQHLPACPPDEREAIARAFVAARGPELKLRTRASIVTETLAVLDHAAFAPIFGPASRAEVPIVAELPAPDGTGAALRVNGQIDRLVRLERELLIVDYKTNRPPPSRPEDVAEAYLLQLAAYRLAVSRVFDGMPVRAALLWTDGPRLMAMPDALLDAAAGRLFALEKARR